MKRHSPIRHTKKSKNSFHFVMVLIVIGVCIAGVSLWYNSTRNKTVQKVTLVQPPLSTPPTSTPTPDTRGSLLQRLGMIIDYGLFTVQEAIVYTDNNRIGPIPKVFIRRSKDPITRSISLSIYDMSGLREGYKDKETVIQIEGLQNGSPTQSTYRQLTINNKSYKFKRGANGEAFPDENNPGCLKGGGHFTDYLVVEENYLITFTSPFSIGCERDQTGEPLEKPLMSTNEREQIFKLIESINLSQ